jgi:hypothetical protein
VGHAAQLDRTQQQPDGVILPGQLLQSHGIGNASKARGLWK